VVGLVTTATNKITSEGEMSKTYRGTARVRVSVEANSSEDAYALITDRLESANDYLDDYDDVDVQEI
jgi:hypothetical protein